MFEVKEILEQLFLPLHLQVCCFELTQQLFRCHAIKVCNQCLLSNCLIDSCWKFSEECSALLVERPINQLRKQFHEQKHSVAASVQCWGLIFLKSKHNKYSENVLSALGENFKVSLSNRSANSSKGIIKRTSDKTWLAITKLNTNIPM